MKMTRSMLSYNSLQQTIIGEIKDVTLVLCTHLEIRKTLSIQVIDMPVRNYSIILGRDWQALTRNYSIILVSHAGKIHNLSYRLEFACTNNFAEFEALLLGIENTLNLGCGHL
jgi:hypothetical protein